MPDHADSSNHICRSVLGEILFISVQNALLNFPHLENIFFIQITLDCLRHPANVIIQTQKIDKTILQTGNELPIAFLQKFGQLFIPGRIEEFRETHGIKIEEVHFPDRETGSLVHGHAQ